MSILNPPPPIDDRVSLVDLLLDEQQRLTAVERFAVAHEVGSPWGNSLETAEVESNPGAAHFGAPSSQPAQARYYRDLLPLNGPGVGEQLAFEVDLDSCSGCKACVAACHNLNGLDEDETWRRVGLLVGAESPEEAPPRLHHVTTACHHCVDPGCLAGCPVRAYEKDSVTGIVRHLDDQCIGCKYCTMMCPYEVPQYVPSKGVVRKCDMCSQRMAVGEAPACVQACPNEAIRIRVVSVEEVRKEAAAPASRLVPGAPLSRWTQPTTRYRSAGVDLASSRAQDAHEDPLGEAHGPLAAMLVLTQAAVGMLLAQVALLPLLGAEDLVPRLLIAVAALFGLAGPHLAILHLGRPHLAFRAVLGLSTSWLSREIVVFGAFMAAVSTLAILTWWPEVLKVFPAMANELPPSLQGGPPNWLSLSLLGAAVGTGAVGLLCSAMIYVATGRSLWRPARTFGRFTGTALVIGAAAATTALVMSESGQPWRAGWLLAAAAITGSKLAWEWRIHLGPRDNGSVDDQRSRKLVRGSQRRWQRCRVAAAAIGIGLLGIGVVGNGLLLAREAAAAAALAGLLLLLLGEFCERILYFTTVVHDRMPGTVR